MPMIHINNSNFYYELHGKGQPMVLISGYTCDHQNFATILDKLSQDFQVLILDNRAIGKTQDQQQALSAELMASDVMNIVRTLGLKNPHIIGHSMGGTVAQVIAANYGEEISNLVLLSTTAKWREAMLKGLASLLMLRKIDVSFDTIFESTLPWVFGEKFLSDVEKIRIFKEILLSNPNPQSIADQERQYAVLKNWNGRAQLSAIQVPTLIGYGTEDLIALPSESQDLAKHIKGSKTIEFNCAHVLPLEVPEALTQAILSFCS